MSVGEAEGSAARGARDVTLAAPDALTRLARLAALPILLLIAAALRLPDLATRGTWDADQGHDMLVLRSLVQDGIVPLLGPPTSIGDVHHGAWYYYVLSPAAALTGGDSPLAVVALIALAGIAAVGVTWWLARSMAGPVAGAVAGLVMALSTAAVDESTFIWNPNLIALSSSIALAGAWRAWATGRPRWWLLAALGLAVTMQCHVLGVALLPVIGGPFLFDVRRRSTGPARSAVLRAGLGGPAILVIAFLPLILHESRFDFSEVRAALRYLGGEHQADTFGLPTRLVIIAIRVVSWPLTGLLTTGLVPAFLGLSGIVAVVGWRLRAPDAPRAERIAVAWLGLALAWTAVFLSIAAPSLAAIVAGLPNDHYHAFADPMVFTLVGIGAAALARRGRPGRGALAVIMLLLGGWNVAHLPPAINPDGGYPAAEAAGDRVDSALLRARLDSATPLVIRSLPDFKSTEAMAYVLERPGRSVDAATPQGPAPGSISPPPVGGRPAFVLLCDQLFRLSIGADCGGPAESAVAPDLGGADHGPLLDRFMVAPGRWLSLYGPR